MQYLFLKDIDLFSHLLNLNSEYEDQEIIIRPEKYSVSFIVANKKK